MKWDWGSALALSPDLEWQWEMLLAIVVSRPCHTRTLHEVGCAVTLTVDTHCRRSSNTAAETHFWAMCPRQEKEDNSGGNAKSKRKCSSCSPDPQVTHDAYTLIAHRAGISRGFTLFPCLENKSAPRLAERYVVLPHSTRYPSCFRSLLSVVTTAGGGVHEERLAVRLRHRPGTQEALSSLPGSPV